MLIIGARFAFGKPELASRASPEHGSVTRVHGREV
jgi:hypothetical protein